jgi:GTP-dependent phosphoenolpyruvate carboxykinase
MVTTKSNRDVSQALSTNRHLLRWVEKMAELTQPKSIHWVDGSKEEYDALCGQMVESGTFIKLNEELWPGSGRAAIMRGQTPAMWPAWRIGRLSVRFQRTAPGPPTTG